MPKKQITNLTPKDVALHAHKWSLSQVEEMIQILDELKTVPVSNGEKVERQICLSNPVASSQQCGSKGGAYIERKIINGYGPYQYLRYQQEGKYKSVYLGKLEAT